MKMGRDEKTALAPEKRFQMKKSTTKKAEGYIAQTLPKKPKSPLQRYRLLCKGKDVLA